MPQTRCTRQYTFSRTVSKIMSIILITFLCCLYGARCFNVHPLVSTPLGDVQGTYSASHQGRKFSQFFGIPFAQPPIGSLRFAEPQPLTKWEGVWIANFSTECLQVSHEPVPEEGKLMGSEDCLYLNVFIPRKNPLEGKPLDVIVHIHGGAFNFGHANYYAGPKYLMDLDVALVTINYRLGPLGFLSTEDEVMPGNLGMKDQVAALRWIKDNIRYFGGNPESVTLTGLSAGGSSVHYHYLSPLSKGLFKGGISISGTALCPWSYQEHPLQKTRRIGAEVGCLQEPTAELVACLKTRPASQIVQAVKIFRPWLYNPFSPVGLVAEKHGQAPFLPDHPYTLLKAGKVHDLPWITSVSADEGLYPSAHFVLKHNYLPDLDRRWEELASHVLDYNYTIPAKAHLSVAQKIKEFYLKGKPISRETFPELTQMIGDRMFYVDSEKAARLQAKANKSPVYHYFFSYSGEVVPSLASHITHSEERLGVCHGDDVMFIFSKPFDDTIPLSDNDNKLQALLLNMWSSFAEKGVPKVKNVKWTPVSKNDDSLFNYLHIKNADAVSIEKAEELGHRSFWDSLLFHENHNLHQSQKDEL